MRFVLFGMKKILNGGFLVVDMAGAIKKNTNPNNYWNVYNSRLTKSAPELVTKCNQLKLISSDGKKYFSDALDYEGIQELAIKMKAGRLFRLVHI